MLNKPNHLFILISKINNDIELIIINIEIIP